MTPWSCTGFSMGECAQERTKYSLVVEKNERINLSLMNTIPYSSHIAVTRIDTRNTMSTKGLKPCCSRFGVTERVL
jgi:hypothetical protein